MRASAYMLCKRMHAQQRKNSNMAHEDESEAKVKMKMKMKMTVTMNKDTCDACSHTVLHV